MYRDTTIEPADFTKTVPVTVPALTDAEIWSLPRFVAWLEKQPAAGRYDPDNCHGQCLLDQFAGRAYAWRDHYGDATAHFTWRIAYAEPFTFGAALSRARAELERVSK